MILKEIRNQTAENHTRLEKSPLLLPFANQHIDWETYVNILRKFYGYFFPLETILNTYGEIPRWLPDFAERRKTKLLWNDLNFLVPGSVPPICESLPRIETTAEAFGCLYVMEGSTLGGKLIFNVLKNTLNLTQSQGASFFYGYGPETGNKWKTFGKALEAYSAAHHADTTIIEAANETFLRLEQWLIK